MKSGGTKLGGGDLEALSCELVRALRGERSQASVSRLLGYKGNVVFAWESGARSPRLGDSLRLISLFGTEPQTAFQILGIPHTECAHKALTNRQSGQLVAGLVGERSHSFLASQIQVDRTTLARWVAGKTQPRLAEFLALLQETTQRLFDFIAHVIDARDLSSNHEAFETFELRRTIAAQYPAVELIFHALELRKYREYSRHSDRFVAKATGLDEEEVRFLLTLLSDLRLIQKKRRHYVPPKDVPHVTVHGDQDCALQRFWFEKVLARFEQQPRSEDLLNSLSVASVSRSALEQLRALHVQYCEKVRALIEADEEPSEVLLLNWQFVPMGER